MSGVPGDDGWLARRNDEAAHLLGRQLAASEAEIERLRERNAEHEARYEALEALGVRHDRNAAIEECARVAFHEAHHTERDRIAAAIRGLKS